MSLTLSTEQEADMSSFFTNFEKKITDQFLKKGFVITQAECRDDLLEMRSLLVTR